MSDWNEERIEVLRKSLEYGLKKPGTFLFFGECMDALTEISRCHTEIAELKRLLKELYDEWNTCDDDWNCAEVVSLGERVSAILKGAEG